MVQDRLGDFNDITVQHFFIESAKNMIRHDLVLICNTSLDIVPSQLGDIVELLTPPLEQRGWLVQEFVNIASRK